MSLPGESEACRGWSHESLATQAGAQHSRRALAAAVAAAPGAGHHDRGRASIMISETPRVLLQAITCIT